ncbi:DNA-binding protein SMUBP-2-like [Teleopsis dalmanni]|uniref:DNA-binding protein SMUBP-2-like n=1 Tax=Teleopsis dalmanni TaxID=139649 RepID=UPI000D32AA69|nr:DNA-binding protein SMUBP-2-like [Teleopsis dalmanni]XP_037956111.1 DNA-binding protein SMUBP-2-like [Teleopsis dalmanni]
MAENQQISETKESTSTNQKDEKSDPPLFPAKPGKKPNYGTNNTLELLEKIPSKIVDLKLDEVLTAVKTVDNMCDFPRCKTKTSLIGQDCEHCRKRYCFKHALPEVHGCGEAIKKNERTKFLHPTPAQTKKQEKDLVKAKKKLHEKLDEMQLQRKQKPAGTNSNSGKKKKGK